MSRVSKSVKKLCKLNKVPFIVNDDIEMALELSVDGVHITFFARESLLGDQGASAFLL